MTAKTKLYLTKTYANLCKPGHVMNILMTSFNTVLYRITPKYIPIYHESLVMTHVNNSYAIMYAKHGNSLHEYSEDVIKTRLSNKL